jgi:predicted RNA-binding protein with RPS1 domain
MRNYLLVLHVWYSSSISTSIESHLFQAEAKKKVAIRPDSLPDPGTRIQAYVANTTAKGCFLRLSANVTGRVLIKDLSDEFVSSPASTFPIGKLVDALVLSIPTPNQINLSMRTSVVHGKDNEEEVQKLRIGAVVKGTVHRVTDFGVFVSIDETSLIGLSRKPMAVPSDSTDLKDVYSVGGRVRAKILAIAGSKISLGLKTSCFKDTNEDDDEDEESAEADQDVVDDDDDALVDDENSDDDDLQQLIHDAALQSNSDDDDEEDDDEEGEVGSVDGNDEGLPIKKQKISSAPDSLPSSSKSSTITSTSHKSSTSSSTSSTNAFAQQGNMLFWGSSFQPTAPASDVLDNEGESDEDENGEESEEDAKGGKRKRNRNTTALKAEEEIRKREVRTLVSCLEHWIHSL